MKAALFIGPPMNNCSHFFYKELSKKRMTTKEIRKDKTLPSPTTIFRIFKTTSINKVYEEVEDYKKNNRG